MTVQSNQKIRKAVFLIHKDEEVNQLVAILNMKFHLIASVRPSKQREHFQIYISGKSYEQFRKLIYSSIVQFPSLLYKFPTSRKREISLNVLETQMPKK